MRFAMSTFCKNTVFVFVVVVGRRRRAVVFVVRRRRRLGYITNHLHGKKCRRNVFPHVHFLQRYRIRFRRRRWSPSSRCRVCCSSPSSIGIYNQPPPRKKMSPECVSPCPFFAKIPYSFSPSSLVAVVALSCFLIVAVVVVHRRRASSSLSVVVVLQTGQHTLLYYRGRKKYCIVVRHTVLEWF